MYTHWALGKQPITHVPFMRPCSWGGETEGVSYSTTEPWSFPRPLSTQRHRMGTFGVTLTGPSFATSAACN